MSIYENCDLYAQIKVSQASHKTLEFDTYPQIRANKRDNYVVKT